MCVFFVLFNAVVGPTAQLSGSIASNRAAQIQVCCRFEDYKPRRRFLHFWEKPASVDAFMYILAIIIIIIIIIIVGWRWRMVLFCICPGEDVKQQQPSAPITDANGPEGVTLNHPKLAVDRRQLVAYKHARCGSTCWWDIDHMFFGTITLFISMGLFCPVCKHAMHHNVPFAKLGQTWSNYDLLNQVWRIKIERYLKDTNIMNCSANI